MAYTDIKLTALDGDLAISNGDFTIGEASQQSIHDIMISYPGYYHQFPTVGLGLESYENADVNSQVLKANLSQQLRADGFQVKNPIVTYDPRIDQLTIQPNASRK